ncbi:Uncharacterised protein [Mycobacteroides abscessus subsp. abscessus]|nr:Uncharacterised protein [Mycobacteroides abscessus subsp. abscessus]
MQIGEHAMYLTHGVEDREVISDELQAVGIGGRTTVDTGYDARILHCPLLFRPQQAATPASTLT